MQTSSDAGKSQSAGTRPWYGPIADRIGRDTIDKIWSDWTDKLYRKEVFQLDDFRTIVAQHWPHLARKTIHDRTAALLAYLVASPSDLKRNPNGNGYIWRNPGEIELLIEEGQGGVAIGGIPSPSPPAR